MVILNIIRIQNEKFWQKLKHFKQTGFYLSSTDNGVLISGLQIQKEFSSKLFNVPWYLP